MTSGDFSVTADFLEHQGRKLFYLLLQPADEDIVGSVLYLPPFTEEMHKSRHIAAHQARTMASCGYAVLLLDLTGCGDSGGEFSEATWDVWLEDASVAADTLLSCTPGPLYVWGLRMGALLGCELSGRRNDIHKLLLWQPTLNGEQQIDQFLRSQAVPFAGGEGGFDRATLWSTLRTGESLEIAGYELSSVLAMGLARTRLNDLLPGCPVSWLEIRMRPGQGLMGPSQNVVDNWREKGAEINVSIVIGEPFWRNAESGFNVDLESTTLEVLRR